MLHFEKWKIVLICVVCLFGLAYASPNLSTPERLEKWRIAVPGWLPTKTINLGLDLQGGSHLLLEVGVDAVVKERLESIVDTLRKDLRADKIGYTGLAATKESVKFYLRKPEKDLAATRKVLRRLDPKLETDITNAGKVSVVMGLESLTDLRTQTITQSIEIVRRRIDETGTKEPTIQRQGAERILIQLPGVDDPERIKDLLGKTAKMAFHLTDIDASEATARQGKLSAGSKLLPMANDENGNSIVIKKRVMVSGEMLTDSQPSFDNGSPVVSFKFDTAGARRFCEVTRKNIGKPFAIVLDGEVISAPRIQSAICGGSGIITGNFTVKEANDLSLLLRAGALPAPLTIMEERTVGPSLGADSVAAGKTASIIGMSLVLAFMFVAYGRFGLFANVALLINMALIFAVLSVLQATLTLPGIAGIVLTIGMAVDANVLIFERIREELRTGRSPLSSVDSGYSQALSTIVDANITTLIAAFLLYNFGSGPIKGFSVTLGIGILTSMFSAIMLTRLIVATWLKKNKPNKLEV